MGDVERGLVPTADNPLRCDMHCSWTRCPPSFLGLAVL